MLEEGLEEIGVGARLQSLFVDHEEGWFWGGAAVEVPASNGSRAFQLQWFHVCSKIKMCLTSRDLTCASLGWSELNAVPDTKILAEAAHQDLGRTQKWKGECWWAA